MGLVEGLWLGHLRIEGVRRLWPEQLRPEQEVLLCMVKLGLAQVLGSNEG